MKASKVTTPALTAKSGKVSPWHQAADALLTAQDEGYQIWSADGRMLFANPATRCLFWLPEDQALQSIDDLLVHCVDLAGNPVDRREYGLSVLLDATRNDNETLWQIRAPNQAERWLRMRAYPITLGDETGVISACFDVTQFVRQQTELEQQAYHDALTGLPNRLLLADRLQQALAIAQRRHEILAVCMLDLDGFKPINDRLGHKAGDRMLQEIAYRLRTAVRNDDTAARIGGDEFALLLGGLRTANEGEQALNRLLRDIAHPMQIDGESVSVSASIGVSLFPGDVQDPDMLLRHADQAMYKAKEAGKSRFHIFDPAVTNKLNASRGLLKKIQEALEKEQFRLYYQPKVDCRLGKVVGVEALVRWQHPVLGLRGPGEFLPLIEQDDTIIALGEWVVSEALAQLGRWQQQGIELTVSVNIAARQFLRGNFGVRLGELLSCHPPELVRRLEIEIVETAVLEDINAVSQLIHRYRQDGVRFDLDDFGTGYSSLVHLKRLEADALKIDQTFVRDMLDDPGDLTIVHGVINLAHAFHLGVVAEGVEDIEHILTLMQLGCDVMQGYGLARPMPAEKVTEWMRHFVADPRWRAAEARFPQRDNFTLLLAGVLHRFWRDQVLVAAHATAGSKPWPDLNESASRFAQWRQDCSLTSPMCASALGQLGQRHRDVYRLAQELQTNASQAMPISDTLLDQFHTASNALLELLDSCRRSDKTLT